MIKFGQPLVEPSSDLKMDDMVETSVVYRCSICNKPCILLIQSDCTYSQYIDVKTGVTPQIADKKCFLMEDKTAIWRIEEVRKK